jgi:uncharacterized protein
MSTIRPTYRCPADNVRRVTLTTKHEIITEEQLRAVIGDPLPLVVSKIADRLNPLTRTFVERSPFVCVATSSASGDCDVSPRGDPAGFVRILDDCTLLLPERPGNKIADTLRNIIHNPHIGLLFIVPGVGDTFRVNGRASLTTDPDLLGPSAVEGKVPKLGIRVEIDEAYTQCSKAFRRSDLWNPARHVDVSVFASNGTILAAVCGDPTFDAAAYDTARDERYARREGFY